MRIAVVAAVALINCLLFSSSVTGTSPKDDLAAASSEDPDEDLVLLAGMPMAPCTEPICEGPLAPLHCSGEIVSVAWHLDPTGGVRKDCLRAKTRFPPAEVVSNFEKIKLETPNGVAVRSSDFMEFCTANFEDAPSLVAITPVDWNSEVPPAFNKINNQPMRKFADAIHGIWPELARTFAPEVFEEPDRYKVLAVPHPFIVPGGFFQLYFYWDSYWVLKGLYFSEMTETARGMLQNFAFLLQRRGYIPNSGQIDHSRRTQPPYFVQMIADYYEHTKDREFLAEFLGHAEQELAWWVAYRSVLVAAPNGTRHQLYMFKPESNCPRPGNLIGDYRLGMMHLNSDAAGEEVGPALDFWRSTAGACESGWDFSSRWFAREEGNQTGSGESAKDRRRLTDTGNIVPVDLNVLMALNHFKMAELYETLGDTARETKKNVKGERLAKAIDLFFRDPEGTGVWHDWDLRERKHRAWRGFYVSNVFPLLLLNNGKENNFEEEEEKCRSVMEYLKRTGALNFPGGIPTSLDKSGEQWDFPNQWPPMTHLFVESLLKCRGNAEALTTAREIADRYLFSAFNGWFHPPPNEVGQIWEKYDVTSDEGNTGYGGEYQPQSGFGWSNGVALELIRMFYTTKD